MGRVVAVVCLLLAVGAGVVAVGQFFGLPDAGDHVLHVVDVDGLVAPLFQFVEQFGNAGLDVVYYFFASILLVER